jgi:hypothetical protein
MKTSIFFLIFSFFCIPLFAQKPVPDGAYTVLSGQYGDKPATTVADSDKRIYKIFKDGYWIAPWRMLKDGSFYGCGGGTYSFKDGKYLETLGFYSWDSTAAGQNYSFDYSAEGKFYHQWGTINSEKYPNLWIDEMMKKVDATEPLKNNGLEGAWFIESAEWGKTKYDRKATPDEVGMKIYAYPMMAYGFWNKKTGKFNGAGGGTYQFDGKVLTEMVEVSFWEKPGSLHEINISMGPNNTYTQVTDYSDGQHKEVWRRAPQLAPATNAAMPEKQTLDTPAERERIRQVCMAETQAFLDLNYDAWAAAHYQGEGCDMSWNSPEGTYNNASGWENMTATAKNYMQSATKDTGKLSQTNYSYLIRGDMAYVSFDQSVAHPKDKTHKWREYRVLLYDAVDKTWKIYAMLAFADYLTMKQ